MQRKAYTVSPAIRARLPGAAVRAAPNAAKPRRYGRLSRGGAGP
jgi:hypothetical protein